MSDIDKEEESENNKPVDYQVMSEEEAKAFGFNPIDEPVSVWGWGQDEEGNPAEDLTIELNPDTMEHMQRYYFEWKGSKMYVQKKSIGTDKFEIGIFQDEPE